MHPNSLTGIGRGARLDPAQQGSKWTPSLRVELRGVYLPLVSHPLRSRSGRIERGLMGMTQGWSHWWAWRKSPPLVHQFLQGTKQRGVEGGGRRNGQSRQCSGRHGYEKPGKRSCHKGGRIELTIVESEGGGLPSPGLDDHWWRKGNGNECPEGHSDH